MKYLTQSTTLMGTVTNIDSANSSFTMRCRSGDIFQIHVSSTTVPGVLTNLDELNRDRVPDPEHFNPAGGAPELVRKYLSPDALVVVQGIYTEHEDLKRIEARYLTLMQSRPGEYLFEDTHWWLNQITRLGEEWLDDLFGDRRTYILDDFAALYRTNLNILGLPVGDDNIQECATLSRLIYGLSSAYLLTGQDRFRLAAKAGIKYQRGTFRTLSHDGERAIWAFGKRKSDFGAKILMASENPDDRDTIPLYEQIYALAGLAQYYRISQDWEVLEDIRRTINSFQAYYLDSPENYPQSGTGGYFSHIDYATFRADTEALGDNKLRKNWNSIGDHIPAYLVNLLLALDPPPHQMESLLRTCRKILDTTARLILTKFPDPDSPYVNERFHADWTPDHQWKWQQNRAVVGHNLKIAWNLTRVANYYRYLADEAGELGEKSVAQDHENLATEFLNLAKRLGDAMVTHGLDQVRGGCFDSVERQPQAGLPIEFVWGNTKDFWQQEQGILAYLILHGATGDGRYLALAREMEAFWNIFFLDHDNRGIFFRVMAEGQPVTEGGMYKLKGSHAMGGYHSFELNYLAHIYIRSYVQAPQTSDDSNFCLFFYPDKRKGDTTLNVLPDFYAPGTVKITGIKVNGVPRASFSPDSFKIELTHEELGSQVVVEFRPIRRETS